MKKAVALPFEIVIALAVVAVIVIVLIVSMQTGAVNPLLSLRNIISGSTLNETEIIKARCNTYCSQLEPGKDIVTSQYCRSTWNIENIVYHCYNFMDCVVDSNLIEGGDCVY